MNNSKNILLETFNLIPFSKVKNKDYLPAFIELIEEQKKEIIAITTNTEEPTFRNTIERLEYSGEKLDRVSSLFFHINAAETTPEIQKLAQEISPLLSKLRSDIRLNHDLFIRVKNVYNKRSELKLSVEQETLLDAKYKAFSRNGANLDDANKEVLREIDQELSLLTLKFSENLLKETNNYELHLTKELDLKGLPEGEKEAAALLAKSKGKEGWLITLAFPSYIPFMKYAENRILRKKIGIAAGSQCFKKDEFNNEEIVLRISRLRHQRANLLGYRTHANFVLEERMAETPEKVFDFLNTFLEKAKPFADKELNQLEDFAKELDGIDCLQKWDYLFYSEKLKNKLFSLDDEKLKPYFKLENVIEGAFTVAERLFGLSFIEVKNIDTYHKDVKTYEVRDKDNELVSVFYADFHPREGKRNGAWMNSLKNQRIQNEKNERPHIINVCNFTKPTDSLPSLLTFNEVRTLFHEFGHGLHGMLANTTYPSLSGTSVYWDFVELPSQILENWCYEKECLEIFAKHYETGLSIPLEFVERIKESSSFMQGMTTVRQIRLGLLDMSWHAVDPTNITSVKENESQAIIETKLFPDIDINCQSVSFSHIFAGGYSSGYYSYKWAEVLDADAFELFKEHGIFNTEVGKSFVDNILSRGGTEPPMTLYKRFRGHKPRIEALLVRSGLIS
jgi:Zn-dependent oligopeptidase